MMIIFVVMMMMKYLNSQDIIEKTVLEKTDLFSLLKDEFLKDCLVENVEFLKSILGDDDFEKLIYK